MLEVEATCRSESGQGLALDCDTSRHSFCVETSNTDREFDVEEQSVLGRIQDCGSVPTRVRVLPKLRGLPTVGQ